MAIVNEEEYQKALQRTWELMDAPAGSVEEELLDALADRIYDYERLIEAASDRDADA